jgi:gamma-glutamyltranspeptidase/glutathione hydrolase
MKPLGAAACGHPQTAEAAELILRDGGNAFDAVIAAFLTSCVVEPVLASLGGGGFLLAHTAAQRTIVYDFFAHTPRVALAKDELDFFPIHADFGTTTQEFHIGLASIATPGAVKGVFKIHQDLGSMPMTELAQPAIEIAREGVRMTAFQASILNIIAPILTVTEETRRQYRSDRHPDSLINAGEILKQTPMADFLEALAREGGDLFYHGEIAQVIADICSHGGGQLTRQDLANYTVALRNPVDVRYRKHRVQTNPAPSCGGTLIAFALNLLEHAGINRCEFGSVRHLQLLTRAMRLTNEARFQAHSAASESTALEQLLDARLLSEYRKKISGNRLSLRGTTHMSVIDADGNVAGLTASNGEGCGHMIPDTGVMLNNMLGEEDLNPDGFYRWPVNQRMTSMMAPTLLISPEGQKICLGSGGSNRLRTAILQVLINIIDFGMNLDQAVNLPRVHVEKDWLNVEPGFEADVLRPVLDEFSNSRIWRQQNMFFGGVHAVSEQDQRFSGAGDRRRAGVAMVVAD